MIAANHDRQGVCGQNFSHCLFNIRMALVGFGMDDVRITNVDHTHIRPQINSVIFMIIRSGMTKAEQR